MRMLGHLLSLVLVALGCSSQRAAVGTTAEDPIAMTTRLVAGDRSIAGPLAVGGLHADGAFLSSSDGLFRATLARHSDGVVRVSRGPTSFELRPIGARSVVARMEGGRAVWEGAFPETDVLASATDDQLEILALMRDETAPSEFSWDVVLPTTLTARATADGGVDLLDTRGDPSFRIRPPYAIDARGARRAAKLVFGGGRMRVSLDRSGLAYPIVLDPVIETVTWTLVSRGAPTVTNGAMLGGKLVALGIDSTWEWDPATAIWTNKPTALFPTGNCAIATLEPKTVALCESGHWEWNGSDWAKRTVVMPAGYTSSMARAGTTLVALVRNASTSVEETWIWSGTGWSKGTPATQPSVSASTRLAALGTALLAFDENTNAIYEWTGSDWNSRPTTGKPALHTVYGVASRGSTIVMFGNDAAYGTDAWEYNGTSWVKAASWPNARSTAMMGVTHGTKALWIALDPSEWDGTSLTVRKSAYPGPAPSPFPALASLGDHAILLTEDSSTWHFDGKVWTKRAPAQSPPPRDSALMTGVAGKALLYGGNNLIDGGYWNRDDTWTYDGTTWTEVTGPKPTKTYALGGKLTTVSSRALLQIGTETWTRETGAWTKEPLSVFYPYDSTTGALAGWNNRAYFLGRDAGAQPHFLRWDGVEWSLVGTPLGPAYSAAGDWSPMTALGGKLVLAKGSSVITFDGTWKSRAVSGATPATGYGSIMVRVGDRAILQEGSTARTWSLRVTSSLSGACSDAADCDSGFCADGVCCDTSCAGGCEACTAARKGSGTDGTCAPVRAGTDPKGTCIDSGSPACKLDGQCDGAGACRNYAVATACTPSTCALGSECASGFCADGICCDKVCDGACEACTNAKKGFGVDGVCELVPAGIDPRDRCPLGAGYPFSCAADGMCDGKGACRAFAVAATACGALACNGGVVSGASCDGAGTCSSAPKACAPYGCKDATTCDLACAVDGNCSAGWFCASGACVLQKANGTTAKEARECTSGVLADGVCCNVACTGVCASCALDATVGTCTPRVGAPVHGICPGAGADPCTARACDGKDPEACQAFAGAETACRARGCSQGIETLPASCAAVGACPKAETRKCEPFACDAEACRTRCSEDAHCQSGFTCDVASGNCASQATCDGDHTVTSVGGATHDCTPFKCRGTTCLAVCASSAECVAGAVCDGGRCVAGAPEAEDVGCRMSGRAGHLGSSAPFFITLLAGIARRRRRPRRTPS